MIIRHNIMAMNAHRNMGIHQQAIAKSLKRLSSGYRINSAADDPAGLAISEKMRGQIRGLNMASRNAQNTISMLQTAEGGLNETHSILQRMRELATQSANGTYQDDVDREALELEYQALLSEITRISQYTNYNGINLLDGSMGGVKGADSMGELGIDNIVIGAGATFDKSLPAFLNILDDGTATLTIGDKVYKGTITGGNTLAFTTDDGAITFQSSGTIKAGVLTRIGLDGTNAADLSKAVGANSSSKLYAQIGANGKADQELGMAISNMGASNLGDRANGVFITDTSVAKREDAKKAIDVLDKAINQVSMQRAYIGAQINRLEHTINNLNTTAENLAAAESSIRDADMAQEMMNYTKHSILLQAAQMMLAHANALPNTILEMLKAL